MLRLYTLGRIDLRGENGREVTPILAQPKRLALLVYLALANSSRFRRRDAVVALFWPEFDTERARSALRQSLSYLRRSLGEGVIITRGEEEIGVDPGLLWCDALEFDAASERNPEAAVELYHGDFLPGFFVEGGAPEFESWMDEERQQFRRVAGGSLRRLGEAALSRGDLPQALRHARNAVRLVPEDERAVARLIEVLDRLGDRAGALSTYENFARRLLEELGAEPSPETKALVASVRARTTSTTPLPSTMESDRVVTRAGARAPRWIRAAAAVLLVGAGVLLVLRESTAHGGAAKASSDPNLVAVAPFDELSPGFVGWGEGISDLVSPLLDGAGPLRVVPARRVLQLWRGAADRESATDLGKATGASLIVYGRVLAAGRDTLRITASVLDLRANTSFEVEIRERSDRIDRAGDSLAIAVLRELSRTRPIAAVRGAGLGSSSFPAIKAYLAGAQLYRLHRGDSALAQFERAVALDTTFALAWRGMMNALALTRLGQDSIVRSYGLRAGALNRGLPPRESLLVAADSLYQAATVQTGDPDFPSHVRRLFSTLDEATRRYPDDAEAWSLLGRALAEFSPRGVSLDQTMDAIDRAVMLDSAFAPPNLIADAVQVAVRLDRPAVARRYLRLGASADPGRADAYGFAERMMADPARGLERLDRWADSARLGSVLSAMRALHAWPDSGEAAVRLARIVLRRCLTGDSTAAEAWTEGNWRWSLAHTIAYRGHLHESVEAYPYLGIRLVGFFGGVPRDSFNAVIRRHNAWPAGLPAWAHRGDTALLGIARVRFDSIARAGDGRPLSPGGKHRGVLPTFSRRLAAYDARRAQVYLTLARGDTTGAIQGFRPLIDSLCVGCSWTRFFTDVYVATQLLHARGGDTAAAGWMDHVNVSVPYPGFDVALSHAWGRVKEALGDREGAARAYDRVVRMWAGGDPEILPMVKEARAGLHRLR